MDKFTTRKFGKQRRNDGGSVITKLIFTILGFSLLLFLFKFSGKISTNNFLSGYVDDLKIDSTKHYKETLKNFFDGEASWFPSEKVGASGQPEIAGAAGMLVDINSGDILFEKEAKTQRKIASLTKIMTAVIVLEHKELEDKVYITKTAADVGENSMYLIEGEVYTVEDLMHGLMLNSGNDAAFALAESTAGNTDRFVEWMNFKAKELGLKDTFFVDPSGLDDRTYSTPEDLVRLTRYAMKNPEFKKIVGTVEYEVGGTKDHKYIYLNNQTNLLTTYPGVAGVKTGFTEEAGLCLVTYAEIGGKEVVGVVLNSIDRKGDMVLMLDHAFSTLGIPVIHNLL